MTLFTSFSSCIQSKANTETFDAIEKIAYSRTPSVKQTIITGVTSGIMAGGMKYIAQSLGTHLYYSPRKGWVDACQLRAGDILVTVNGEYVIVEKVQHVILENPIKVYNFEVEDFHTYFVGQCSVLVHNTCKNEYLDDYQTKNTKNESATFNSEGEARNFARTKVGHDPVIVGDNKLRSYDGSWQYRAKPNDVAQNHIHLEKIDIKTGKVVTNWHLIW